MANEVYVRVSVITLDYPNCLSQGIIVTVPTYIVRTSPE